MELRADGQTDVYNNGHLVFTARPSSALDMKLLQVISECSFRRCASEECNTA